MKEAKIIVRAPLGMPEDGGKKRRLLFSRKQLCIPYGVFLVLFVIFPLLLICYYAFTDKGTGAFTV